MTAAPAAPAHAPLAGLMQRLLAVLPVLAPAASDRRSDLPVADSFAASVLLEQVVDAVRSDPGGGRLWLLLVAVSGRYPTAALLDDAATAFALEPVHECTAWLLSATLAADAGGAAMDRPLRLLTGAVLVNVDQTATDDRHTGVQRVVRQTLPVWVAEHDAIPVAWHADRSGFRTLDARERHRVLAWGSEPPPSAGDDGPADELLVPWGSVVVVVDIDPVWALDRLVPVAARSGNACVGIGYDCIPVVSADLIPWGGAGLFSRYLELVKHLRAVAGISRSATVEFQGFADALPAQGLAGPRVVECPLPYAPVPPAPTAGDRGGPPLITAVGSYEPRKNHLAVLHAAEVLWRAGLRFRLRFIGGMAWGSEVVDRIAELAAAGRPVEALHAVTDEALADAYRASRATVFPSLHEGYGLPVVESLAAGTPVITSSYGSTAELAAGGGVLLVDPRDDGALVDALRAVLTDDALVAALRAEIAARPRGSWAAYAASLWACAVAPELRSALHGAAGPVP